MSVLSRIRATGSLRRFLTLPKTPDLLCLLDFRQGTVRDLISDTDFSVSGTGASWTYSIHGEALSLTSAGSDYIDTGIDAPASGSALVLFADTAGAGNLSPVWSDGFGADGESIRLDTAAGDSTDLKLWRSGGNLMTYVIPSRLTRFSIVGLAWGDPGRVVAKTVNAYERPSSAWDYTLDPARGVDVHLNVSSSGSVSQFGDNVIAFFALWNSALHARELQGVARQLLAEVEF